LWLLLRAPSTVLAARHIRVVRNVPVAALPARGARRPTRTEKWRYLTAFQQHWWLIGWLDRLSEARWRRRVEIEGLADLKRVLADRPVVLVTIHTSSVVALAPLIRATGIPTAAMPADPSWFTSPARRRKVALAERIGDAPVFGRGSMRDLIAYLKPGRLVLIAADHSGGRQVEVPWSGGRALFSTTAFRVARSTGSAVVPVLITTTGRWRYRITLLPAVPAQLVVSQDHEAAAADVAERLVPLAAAVPEQATDNLVAALS
jgi:lauroyl/myristoyl acyltransferase